MLLAILVFFMYFTTGIKITDSKVEVKLFDDKNSFIIWQSNIKVILVMQELIKVLFEKLKNANSTSDNEWKELEMKVVNTICLMNGKTLIFEFQAY